MVYDVIEPLAMTFCGYSNLVDPATKVSVTRTCDRDFGSWIQRNITAEPPGFRCNRAPALNTVAVVSRGEESSHHGRASAPVVLAIIFIFGSR